MKRKKKKKKWKEKKEEKKEKKRKNKKKEKKKRKNEKKKRKENPQKNEKKKICLYWFLELWFSNLFIHSMKQGLWDRVSRASSWGVVAKELHCDIVVSEFEIQSRYYIHFWT